jgi:hypothetical protein
LPRVPPPRSFAAVAMAGLRPPAGGTGGAVPRPLSPGVSAAGTRPPNLAQVTDNQFAPTQVPIYPPQTAAAQPVRGVRQVQFGAPTQ